MSAKERFQVIEGGAGVEPKRRRSTRKPAAKTQWACRQCDADIGVATNLLVEVKQGALESEGGSKITGGHKAWACAMCLARGKMTYTTS